MPMMYKYSDFELNLPISLNFYIKFTKGKLRNKTSVTESRV